MFFALMGFGSLNAETTFEGPDCDNCFCVYHTMYNDAIAAGFTERQAFGIATTAFNNCVNQD